MSEVEPEKETDWDAHAGLTTGAKLVLTRYGQLYADAEGARQMGGTILVGTELVFREMVGCYCRVASAEGVEGWAWTGHLSRTDPRVFVAVRGSPLRGYLVGDLYPDASGGSLTETVIEVPGLGPVRARVASIRSIELLGPGQATLHLDDGSTLTGALLRCWIVGKHARVLLDQAGPMTIDRVDPPL